MADVSIMMSAEVGEVFAALVKAQKSFKSVAKGAENPFFKSKYADLPSVIETAQPILSENDLGVIHMPVSINDGDGLSTLLVHKSGQYIGAVTKLHMTKDDPQAHGSAITYARRYGFMAILNLVAGDDDDGNAASEERPSNQDGVNYLMKKAREHAISREEVIAGFGAKVAKHPRDATTKELKSYADTLGSAGQKADTAT